MSELSNRLSKLPISMSTYYAGFCSDAEWKCFDWRVTISYCGRVYSAEYHTGIGHTTLTPGCSVLSLYGRAPTFSTPRGNMRQLEAISEGYLKPVEPDLADVMSCLLADASDVSQTFEEWCYSLGYDTDSRKALDIYLKCQETRASLIRLLGHNLFDELSGLEH